MISIYAKNRPWDGEPRADYIQVLSERPAVVRAYRIEGERLVPVPTADGYVRTYAGWFHPATAWEIEEYKRLGGTISATMIDPNPEQA